MNCNCQNSVSINIKNMYGEELYGGEAIGYSWTIPTVSLEDISFDGFWLQNSKIIVSKFNVDDTPDVDYSDVPTARADGVTFLSKYWRKRKIIVSWYIKDDTKALLDVAMDTLKRNLRTSNAIFRYKIADDSYRQVLATMTSIRFSREHYHITHCPFTIEFETSEPFIYDSTLNTLLVETVTSATTVTEISNEWSEISYPQIYVIFNSATSVTSVSFNLGGRTIGISETINTNDVILIDCLNKIVSINGVSKDYTGTFPFLDIGTNILTFTINGTFSLDISAIYRSNFL